MIVAYASPFIPPEWIAAHGLRPRWFVDRAPRERAPVVSQRGACPVALAFAELACSNQEVRAVVLASSCDQLRYAAAVAEHFGSVPSFLMNLPATWQTDTSRRIYRSELERLGRFLVARGGMRPTTDALSDRALCYDRARQAVLSRRRRLTGRRFAEALSEVRSGGGSFSQSDPPLVSPTLGRWEPARPAGGIPLAVVGGPVLPCERGFYDVVERAGGRVVLDATESGERTLPAPFDKARLAADPLGELVRAYFDTIPDAFRRPNRPLYDWLGRRMVSRGVRGAVFRRHVWCDIWHGELKRFCDWSAVPVLDVDCDEEAYTLERTGDRLEAFLESLRPVKEARS